VTDGDNRGLTAAAVASISAASLYVDLVGELGAFSVTGGCTAPRWIAA
jgi:hypothetical protein